MEHLFRYAEKLSDMTLSEKEKEMISSAFKPKKLRKRQYFLQEGDVCKFVGFIIKGATRMYSVDQKGNEHILRFSIEEWWVGDSESYTDLVPSKYNIDAVEDTEMLVTTFALMQPLMAEIPAIAKMIRTMDQRSYIASQRRMHASITMTAEERYDDFYGSYPQLLQRFPQGMIASYLGISPETLSRIRKNAGVKP
ncbi:Crp/Fnr family transcriptional regulator [Mucilaginibacter sp. UR6-1]|uniref:Crp/Fnr family transcriptional regulator n=1 Tax=Mucilaginibacter sp. UR6-1 TaxID=1435643 RepID=UPI001E292AAF|nr:Crp/Fnr family transcriptional regulator [Mucilaginibacter sp. UR6-1]MCC8407757.1 Crp/Fnr family transcriptional regulator [Mucilaginibacter sp. UR6-1]